MKKWLFPLAMVAVCLAIIPLAPSVMAKQLPMTDGDMSLIEGEGNFYKGQCTWYVDQLSREKNKWNLKNGVPWQGNANTWITNAKKAGYKTGSAPKDNSIVQLKESSWGHVAWVLDYNKKKKTIKITEMNYKGVGVKSTRTLKTSYNKIQGYIYKK